MENAYGLNIPQNLAETCNPRRTALWVYDMQVGIIRQASEVIFDKITLSAFEGTPLDIALRDCGINSFIIVGVATEIGIEPTIRHGADLGYIPIVVRDACGAGHAEAGERALASIEFMGDAVLTDIRTIQDILGRMAAA
jgi:nicotinamidase-related amidase